MSATVPPTTFDTTQAVLDDAVLQLGGAQAALRENRHLPEAAYPKLATIGRLRAGLGVLDQVKQMQAELAAAAPNAI